METSYDGLLKEQLKQLHEVLLQGHQEETRVIKQQLFALGLRQGGLPAAALGPSPGPPRASASRDSWPNVEEMVPEERQPLEREAEHRWGCGSCRFGGATITNDHQWLLSSD
eukprot:Skav231066  [mRNA]  locus=scaffold524:29265:30644:+ [translate_table: standard]